MSMHDFHASEWWLNQENKWSVLAVNCKNRIALELRSEMHQLSVKCTLNFEHLWASLNIFEHLWAWFLNVLKCSKLTVLIRQRWMERTKTVTFGTAGSYWSEAEESISEGTSSGVFFVLVLPNFYLDLLGSSQVPTAWGQMPRSKICHDNADNAMTFSNITAMLTRSWPCPRNHAKTSSSECTIIPYGVGDSARLWV